MERSGLGIEGVWLVTPSRIGDERGFFSEVYNKRTFEEMGISDEFVQDNHSLSGETGTVRGLHFQIEPNSIAKLVRVISGAIWDVVVDIRQGSPSFGEHVAVELSADNWSQIYVPVGFAHGFCTLTPATEVCYKVTGHWSPEVDKGVAWDDPDLAIDWPVDPQAATLSDKDRALPRLREIPDYFEWSDN